MRPIKQTLSATGPGVWVPLNYRQKDFKVGVAVLLNDTTTAQYTVEHTYDNVLAGDVARAFPHPLLTNKSANLEDGYTSPVMAVRLNVASISVGGSLDFIVIQGDDAP